MDLSAFQDIFNKLSEFGNFLFGTYLGIGILIGAVLLLCLIIAAALEKRTKRLYVDHPKEEELDEDEENLSDDNKNTKTD